MSTLLTLCVVIHEDLCQYLVTCINQQTLSAEIIEKPAIHHRRPNNIQRAGERANTHIIYIRK